MTIGWLSTEFYLQGLFHYRWHKKCLVQFHWRFYHSIYNTLLGYIKYTYLLHFPESQEMIPECNLEQWEKETWQYFATVHTGLASSTNVLLNTIFLSSSLFYLDTFSLEITVHIFHNYISVLVQCPTASNQAPITVYRSNGTWRQFLMQFLWDVEYGILIWTVFWSSVKAAVIMKLQRAWKWFISTANLNLNIKIPTKPLERLT